MLRNIDNARPQEPRLLSPDAHISSLGYLWEQAVKVCARSFEMIQIHASQRSRPLPIIPLCEKKKKTSDRIAG